MSSESISCEVLEKEQKAEISHEAGRTASADRSTYDAVSKRLRLNRRRTFKNIS